MEKRFDAMELSHRAKFDAIEVSQNAMNAAIRDMHGQITNLKEDFYQDQTSKHTPHSHDTYFIHFTMFSLILHLTLS